MPDRVQVPDLYKDRGFLPAIQPAARPVDTFINPGQPQVDKTNAKLNEVVRAWSEVQPGLTQFAMERVDHNNKQKMEDGRKAALANKEAFKEAREKGLIPLGADPWFQVGYERQQAQRSAIEYDQAIGEAYNKTSLPNSDDPAAVTKWMAEFTQGWLGSRPDAQSNPEFDRVFTPMASKAQSNLQVYHAGKRTQLIEQKAIDDAGFLVDATLDRSRDLLGVVNPETGKDLAEIVRTQVENGLPGHTANKIIADAVIRKAVEEGDITLLDLLDEVPSGNGTVGRIGIVKDVVARARDTIATDKTKAAKLAEAQSKFDRDERARALKGAGLKKIFADPFQADISPEFNELADLDPEAAASMTSFRSSYIGVLTAQSKVPEDQKTKANLTLAAIYGTLDDEQVTGALQDRLIDTETAQNLLVNLKGRADAQRGPLSNPYVARAVKNLRDVITKNDLADTFADGRAFRANEAEALFLDGMLDYMEKNPKATHREIIKEAREFSKELLQDIRGGGSDDAPLPDVEKEMEHRQKVREGHPEAVQIFKDREALLAALDEYNTTKGTKGVLVETAARFGMTPQQLLQAQTRLMTVTTP